MSDLPLAYHITFGTYGTRLHGDPRGTVARVQPAPGSMYIDEDEQWEKIEKKSLNFAPVELDEKMRYFIERQIPEICKRGSWMYINAAAQTDHVHVLLSAYVDGKAVRRWLKHWLGEALREQYPGVFRRRPNKNSRAKPTWWAEGGCIKHVGMRIISKRCTNISRNSVQAGLYESGLDGATQCRPVEVGYAIDYATIG